MTGLARVVAKITLALGSLAVVILVMIEMSPLGHLYRADYAPMQIAIGVGIAFSSATIACLPGLLTSIENRARIAKQERTRGWSSRDRGNLIRVVALKSDNADFLAPKGRGGPRHAERLREANRREVRAIPQAGASTLISRMDLRFAPVFGALFSPVGAKTGEF